MARLQINGQPEDIDVPDNMPLLWALRDELGMTGTKFGCGMAVCGACTVHMDGSPIRACVTPVSSVAGREISTISRSGYRTVSRLQPARRRSGGFS